MTKGPDERAGTVGGAVNWGAFGGFSKPVARALATSRTHASRSGAPSSFSGQSRS